MIQVVILGFGNVGQQLCAALQQTSEVSIIQVFNRHELALNATKKTIPFTTQLSELKEADVYIIAIPDDAITGFSKELPLKNKLVVHSSGGVAMNVLAGNNRKGVFYPLQTFSKGRAVNFYEIPICIEAENASDLNILKKVGAAISKNVVEINSEERAKLHLTAVFVNNFVNHIYHISEEILKENDLNFDLLKPLITETAAKILTLSPSEAQTGPAKRNDRNTIEKHLDLLASGLHKELYTQLTEAIQKTNTNT